MFARFRQVRQRLTVDLLHSRRVGGKVRTGYLGPLGSVLWGEPIGVVERIAFWSNFDTRWRAIVARHPSVTLDDRTKVRLAIDRRIPQPRGEDELRLQRLALVRCDVLAAFDRAGNAEDALEEAGRRLRELRARRDPIAEERATQS